MTILEFIGLAAIAWVIYYFIIMPEEIDFTVIIDGETVIDYHRTLSKDDEKEDNKND